MENQKMASKRKKWLIGTVIVLVYMFFVWFFAPEGDRGGGGWFAADPGKDNIIIAFFDLPIIFGYLVFCSSMFFSKNQPFLPTKETTVGQARNAFTSIPIIALIVLAILFFLPSIFSLIRSIF